MSLKSLLIYGDPNGILLGLVFFGVLLAVLGSFGFLINFLIGETPQWIEILFLIPALLLALFVMLKVNEWLDAHAW